MVPGTVPGLHMHSAAALRYEDQGELVLIRSRPTKTQSCFFATFDKMTTPSTKDLTTFQTRFIVTAATLVMD